MAFGFEAKNDSGNVIINDSIENLHFFGKATRGGSSVNFSEGGNSGNFPNYSGSNDTLDGRCIWTYTITLASGTPVAFIKPADYSRWHAIVKQSLSSTTWTFQIMISGTSTSNPPEVYCFVNADDIPVPGGETQGMIVFKSDGSTKTFDSRRQPLAITGGGSAISPSDPTNTGGTPGTTNNASWQAASCDHDFRSSNQSNEYSTSNANTSTTMFSCPSIAQAVYSRVINGYKCSNYWFGGCQEHWSTAWWWVMYRQAFRLRSGYFDSGWTGYEAGFFYDEHYESGGWFGSGSGGYSSGNAPYTNKTINLQSNAYIIADSSRYN